MDYSSPKIFGTRKRLSCADGAQAKTSARSTPGRTTSSRSTLTKARGCAVGCTPAMSSAAMASKVPMMARSSVVMVSSSASVSARRANLATCTTWARVRLSDIGVDATGTGLAPVTALKLVDTTLRQTVATLCAVAAKQYPFLSDQWIAAARRIRDTHLGEAESIASSVLPGGTSVRMNQIITDVPFGDGVIDAHIDSSSGSLSLDLGHIDSPDVTITVDYPTAKAIFVDQDMALAMQAFMTGRIRVDGDLTKLLALQSFAPEQLPDGAKTRAYDVAAELKAITAE